MHDYQPFIFSVKKENERRHKKLRITDRLILSDVFLLIEFSYTRAYELTQQANSTM